MHIELSSPLSQLEYPYLCRMLRVRNAGRGLDKEAVRKDVEKLKARVKEKVTDSRWRNELTEGLAKQEMPRSFFESLYAASLKYQFSVEEYTALRKFSEHLVLQSEITGPEFFSELESLIGKLMDRLARTPQEKELLARSREIRLSEKVMKFEATSEEWEHFVGAGLVPARGQPQGLPLQTATRFYELAERRNTILLENTLAKMKAAGTKRAILITGGFHTEGITSLLKQKNISHLVFQPRIREEFSQKKYHESVLGTSKTIFDRAQIKTVMGMLESLEQFSRLGGDPERQVAIELEEALPFLNAASIGVDGSSLSAAPHLREAGFSVRAATGGAGIVIGVFNEVYLLPLGGASLGSLNAKEVGIFAQKLVDGTATDREVLQFIRDWIRTGKVFDALGFPQTFGPKMLEERIKKISAERESDKTLLRMGLKRLRVPLLAQELREANEPPTAEAIRNFARAAHVEDYPEAEFRSHLNEIGKRKDLGDEAKVAIQDAIGRLGAREAERKTRARARVWARRIDRIQLIGAALKASLARISLRAFETLARARESRILRIFVLEAALAGVIVGGFCLWMESGAKREGASEEEYYRNAGQIEREMLEAGEEAAQRSRDWLMRARMNHAARNEGPMTLDESYRMYIDRARMTAISEISERVQRGEFGDISEREDVLKSLSLDSEERVIERRFAGLKGDDAIAIEIFHALKRGEVITGYDIRHRFLAEYERGLTRGADLPADDSVAGRLDLRSLPAGEASLGAEGRSLGGTPTPEGVGKFSFEIDRESVSVFEGPGLMPSITDPFLGRLPLVSSGEGYERLSKLLSGPFHLEAEREARLTSDEREERRKEAENQFSLWFSREGIAVLIHSYSDAGGSWRQAILPKLDPENAAVRRLILSLRNLAMNVQNDVFLVMPEGSEFDSLKAEENMELSLGRYTASDVLRPDQIRPVDRSQIIQISIPMSPELNQPDPAVGEIASRTSSAISEIIRKHWDQLVKDPAFYPEGVYTFMAPDPDDPDGEPKLMDYHGEIATSGGGPSSETLPDGTKRFWYGVAITLRHPYSLDGISKMMERLREVLATEMPDLDLELLDEKIARVKRALAERAQAPPRPSSHGASLGEGDEEISEYEERVQTDPADLLAQDIWEEALELMGSDSERSGFIVNLCQFIENVLWPVNLDETGVKALQEAREFYQAFSQAVSQKSISQGSYDGLPAFEEKLQPDQPVLVTFVLRMLKKVLRLNADKMDEKEQRIAIELLLKVRQYIAGLYDWTFSSKAVNPSQILEGHLSSVLSISFNPDGRTLASGSSDGIIRIWNWELGEELRMLQGHESPVHSLAFSPDGKTLAAGSSDGIIRIWNWEQGKELQGLRGHEGLVNSLAFHPQGKMLTSVSSDGTIRIWDWEQGRELRVLREHGCWVNSLAFNPDGTILASGSIDGTIRIWDWWQAKEWKVLQGHRNSVNSLAFSRDGKLLVSGGEDSTLRIWDWWRGEERKVLRGHRNSVNSLAFSPGGKLLVSGGEDSTLRIWDWELRDEEPQVFQGHEGGVNSLAFSPDGNTLASGSQDKTIRIWSAPLRPEYGFLLDEFPELEPNLETLVLDRTISNLLKKAGIHRVDQLAAFSAEKLLDLPGIGQESIAIIRRALAQSNLTLRGDKAHGGGRQTASGRSLGVPLPLPPEASDFHHVISLINGMPPEEGRVEFLGDVSDQGYLNRLRNSIRMAELEADDQTRLQDLRSMAARALIPILAQTFVREKSLEISKELLASLMPFKERFRRSQIPAILSRYLDPKDAPLFSDALVFHSEFKQFVDVLHLEVQKKIFEEEMEEFPKQTKPLREWFGIFAAPYGYGDEAQKYHVASERERPRTLVDAWWLFHTPFTILTSYPEPGRDYDDPKRGTVYPFKVDVGEFVEKVIASSGPGNEPGNEKVRQLSCSDRRSLYAAAYCLLRQEGFRSWKEKAPELIDRAAKEALAESQGSRPPAATGRALGEAALIRKVNLGEMPTEQELKDGVGALTLTGLVEILRLMLVENPASELGILDRFRGMGKEENVKLVGLSVLSRMFTDRLNLLPDRLDLENYDRSVFGVLLDRLAEGKRENIAVKARQVKGRLQSAAIKNAARHGIFYNSIPEPTLFYMYAVTARRSTRPAPPVQPPSLPQPPVPKPAIASDEILRRVQDALSQKTLSVASARKLAEQLDSAYHGEIQEYADGSPWNDALGFQPAVLRLPYEKPRGPLGLYGFYMTDLSDPKEQARSRANQEAWARNQANNQVNFRQHFAVIKKSYPGLSARVKALVDNYERSVLEHRRAVFARIDSLLQATGADAPLAILGNYLAGQSPERLSRLEQAWTSRDISQIREMVTDLIDQYMGSEWRSLYRQEFLGPQRIDEVEVLWQRMTEQRPDFKDTIHRLYEKAVENIRRQVLVKGVNQKLERYWQLLAGRLSDHDYPLKPVTISFLVTTDPGQLIEYPIRFANQKSYPAVSDFMEVRRFVAYGWWNKGDYLIRPRGKSVDVNQLSEEEEARELKGVLLNGGGVEVLKDVRVVEAWPTERFDRFIEEQKKAIDTAYQEEEKGQSEARDTQRRTREEAERKRREEEARQASFQRITKGIMGELAALPEDEASLRILEGILWRRDPREVLARVKPYFDRENRDFSGNIPAVSRKLEDYSDRELQSAVSGLERMRVLDYEEISRKVDRIRGILDQKRREAYQPIVDTHRDLTLQLLRLVLQRTDKPVFEVYKDEGYIQRNWDANQLILNFERTPNSVFRAMNQKEDEREYPVEPFTLTKRLTGGGILALMTVKFAPADEGHWLIDEASKNNLEREITELRAVIGEETKRQTEAQEAERARIAREKAEREAARRREEEVRRAAVREVAPAEIPPPPTPLVEPPKISVGDEIVDFVQKGQVLSEFRRGQLYNMIERLVAGEAPAKIEETRSRIEEIAREHPDRFDEIGKHARHVLEHLPSPATGRSLGSQDAYRSAYDEIRRGTQTLKRIEEKDLARSRTFLTPEGTLKSPGERLANGTFGVTEVFFLPDSETRRRMVAFQEELKAQFGSQVYLVDPDQLHMTTQGLELRARHAGKDIINPGEEPYASLIARAREIVTPQVTMEVGGVNGNPLMGIFWELRPYLRAGESDPIIDRRQAWNLRAPWPPHITAAYFAQPFTDAELSDLRALIARYQNPNYFGAIEVAELRVIAYEDFSFNAGYRVLGAIPLTTQAASLGRVWKTGPTSTLGKGRFTIEGVIGERGGQATLLLANDARRSGQQVILKMLPDDPKDTKEFLRTEAMLMMGLQPEEHIPQVYELYDEEGAEESLIVMEYIEGDSLAQWLAKKNGALTLKGTIEKLIPIAEVLDHAHRRNIVHLDVKPQNVLIQERDGKPVLIDFGLAVEKGEVSGVAMSQSVISVIDQRGRGGTLPYSAPERFRGEEPQAAADLWSFGVMLYLFATGSYPFEEKRSPEGKLVKEIRDVILEDKPERPSVVALRNGKPPIPEDLEALILKMLSKDPAERTASMKEVAEAIRHIQWDGPFADANAPKAADAVPPQAEKPAPVSTPDLHSLESLIIPDVRIDIPAQPTFQRSRWERFLMRFWRFVSVETRKDWAVKAWSEAERLVNEKPADWALQAYSNIRFAGRFLYGGCPSSLTDPVLAHLGESDKKYFQELVNFYLKRIIENSLTDSKWFVRAAEIFYNNLNEAQKALKVLDYFLSRAPSSEEALELKRKILRNEAEKNPSGETCLALIRFHLDCLSRGISLAGVEDVVPNWIEELYTRFKDRVNALACLDNTAKHPNLAEGALRAKLRILSTGAEVTDPLFGDVDALRDCFRAVRDRGLRPSTVVNSTRLAGVLANRHRDTAFALEVLVEATANPDESVSGDAWRAELGILMDQAFENGSRDDVNALRHFYQEARAREVQGLDAEWLIRLPDSLAQKGNTALALEVLGEATANPDLSAGAWIKKGSILADSAHQNEDVLNYQEADKLFVEALKAVGNALRLRKYWVDQKEPRLERLRIRALALEKAHERGWDIEPDTLQALMAEVDADLDYVFRNGFSDSFQEKLSLRYRAKIRAWGPSHDYAAAQKDLEKVGVYWGATQAWFLFVERAEVAFEKGDRGSGEDFYQHALTLCKDKGFEQLKARIHLSQSVQRAKAGLVKEAVQSISELRNLLDPTTAISWMMKKLTHGNANVRKVAAIGIGKMGEPSIQPLMEKLASPIDREREAAVTGLTNNTASDVVLDLLLAKLQDEKVDGKTREAVIHALGGMGEKAIYPLIERTRDESEIVRGDAGKALASAALEARGKVPLEPVVDALVRGIRENEGARLKAINALAQLDPEAFRRVLDEADDELLSWMVQRTHQIISINALRLLECKTLEQRLFQRQKPPQASAPAEPPQPVLSGVVSSVPEGQIREAEPKNPGATAQPVSVQGGSESPLERGGAEGDGVCEGNNTPQPLRGHPSQEGNLTTSEPVPDVPPASVSPSSQAPSPPAVEESATVIPTDEKKVEETKIKEILSALEFSIPGEAQYVGAYSTEDLLYVVFTSDEEDGIVIDVLNGEIETDVDLDVVTVGLGRRLSSEKIDRLNVGELQRKREEIKDGEETLKSLVESQKAREAREARRAAMERARAASRKKRVWPGLEEALKQPPQTAEPGSRASAPAPEAAREAEPPIPNTGKRSVPPTAANGAEAAGASLGRPVSISSPPATEATAGQQPLSLAEKEERKRAKREGKGEGPAAARSLVEYHSTNVEGRSLGVNDKKERQIADAARALMQAGIHFRILQQFMAVKGLDHHLTIVDPPTKLQIEQIESILIQYRIHLNQRRKTAAILTRIVKLLEDQESKPFLQASDPASSPLVLHPPFSMHFVKFPLVRSGKEKGLVDLKKLLVPSSEIPKGEDLKRRIREYIGPVGDEDKGYVSKKKRGIALRNLEDTRLLPYLEKAAEHNVLLVVSRTLDDWDGKFRPYLDLLMEIFEGMPQEMLWELNSAIGFEVTKTKADVMGFLGTEDTWQGGGVGMSQMEISLAEAMLPPGFKRSVGMDNALTAGGRYDFESMRETLIHEIFGHKRSITKRRHFEIQGNEIRENPDRWEPIIDRAAWQAVARANHIERLIPLTDQLKKAIGSNLSIMGLDTVDVEDLPEDPQKLLDLMRRIYQLPSGYYSDILELVAFTTEGNDLSVSEKGKGVPNADHNYAGSREILKVSNARLGIPVDPVHQVYVSYTYEPNRAKRKSPYQKHYLQNVGTGEQAIWQEVLRVDGEWVPMGEPVDLTRIGRRADVPKTELPPQAPPKQPAASVSSPGDSLTEQVEVAVKKLVEKLIGIGTVLNHPLEPLAREEVMNEVENLIRIRAQEKETKPASFSPRQAVIWNAFRHTGLTRRDVCAEDVIVRKIVRQAAERLPTQAERAQEESFVDAMVSDLQSIKVRDSRGRPIRVFPFNVLMQIHNVGLIREGNSPTFFPTEGEEQRILRVFLYAGFHDAARYSQDAYQYLMGWVAVKLMNLQPAGGRVFLSAGSFRVHRVEDIQWIYPGHPRKVRHRIHFNRPVNGKFVWAVLEQKDSLGNFTVKTTKMFNPGQSIFIRGNAFDLSVPGRKSSRRHIELRLDDEGQNVTIRALAATYLVYSPLPGSDERGDTLSHRDGASTASGGSLGFGKKEQLLFEAGITDRLDSGRTAVIMESSRIFTGGIVPLFLVLTERFLNVYHFIMSQLYPDAYRTQAAPASSTVKGFSVTLKTSEYFDPEAEKLVLAMNPRAVSVVFYLQDKTKARKIRNKIRAALDEKGAPIGKRFILIPISRKKLEGRIQSFLFGKLYSRILLPLAKKLYEKPDELLTQVALHSRITVMGTSELLNGVDNMMVQKLEAPSMAELARLGVAPEKFSQFAAPHALHLGLAEGRFEKLIDPIRDNIEPPHRGIFRFKQDRLTERIAASLGAAFEAYQKILRAA